jgi:predicted amidohydrolase
VIEVSETRLKACLNISSTGMVSPVVGELEDIRLIDPKKAIEVCERHRDVIVGVKARLSENLAGNNALPALHRAREAADAVGLPIMIHPNAPVCTLDDILREMKARAHETGVSLTRVANDVLRVGLDRRASISRSRRRYREEVADLGEPRVNLDRALALAAQLEDEETLRKLEQRK